MLSIWRQEKHNNEKNQCMNNSRIFCFCPLPCVHRASCNCSCGGNCIEERQHHICNSLADKLLVAFVLCACHCIAHYRTEQRFNRAKQCNCKCRWQNFSHKVEIEIIQLRHRKPCRNRPDNRDLYCKDECGN